MSKEYRALVEKVDAFTQATAARRKADLTCSAGCSSCCHAWLTVRSVEADELRAGLAALPSALRAEVRVRGERELAREAEGAVDARCALLDDAGQCVVYAARPLVCRTQGHALRYPSGFIPSDAISRKTPNGEETWCPLNYHAREPNPEDVLDAERVDQILAVVAARHSMVAATIGHQADERSSLSMLAAELPAAEAPDARTENQRNDPTVGVDRSESADG